MDFAAFFFCGGVIALGVIGFLCVVAFSQIGTLRAQLARLQWRLDLLEREGAAGGLSPRDAARERLLHGTERAGPIPVEPERAPVTEEAPAAPVVEQAKAEPVSEAPVGEAAQEVVSPETVYEIPLAPREAVIAPPVQSEAARTMPPPPPLPPKNPAEVNLEAFLGTRVFVAIGAVALALAAIYLMKYAVEKELISPMVRVLAGAVAGMVLLGIAQWRRRHEEFLAQGLSAAGIVALFAASYAATSMYGFLPRGVGFGAMAAITAVAVGLSLQKPGGGQLLAGLGLLGGLLTPLLIGSEKPNVPGLFGYLILLHVALVAVTRMRGWPILAALAMLGSSAWVLIWLALRPWSGEDGLVLGGVMLAAVGSLIMATWEEDDRRWEGANARQTLTWLAAVLGLLAGLSLVSKSNFELFQWGYFGLLVAGAMVLARLRSMYLPLAWIANVAVLVLLYIWYSDRTHVNPETFRAQALLVLAVFGPLFSLGAYACLWKSKEPQAWAALHAVLAVGYTLMGYWIVGVAPRPDTWALLPIAVCGVMGILALPLLKVRDGRQRVEDGLGLMAHGMLALLLIAGSMALEESALTAAWAALLPATAWALLGLRLPSLTIGLVTLFFIAAFRGAVFPFTFAQSSEMPGVLVWNPIVWTYGSLLLAMMLALIAIPRFKPFWKDEFTALPTLANLGALFQTAAMAAAFLLLTFSIRWGAQEGAVTAQAMPLMERATYPIGWLVLAAALVGVAVRFKSAAASAGAQASTWMALLWVFCINTLLFSPLLTRDEIVGSIVFNSMLCLYGIPMLVFAGVGWRLETGKHDMLETLKVSSGIVALVLLFALVTLNVRFLFHGPMLSGEAVTTPEMTAYSMAWAILGGVLLLGGIATRSITLRWASLVIMFLTVVKVFIFDLAGLKDLLRVLSFAGLGVSLMLLAFIYQRFVFRAVREEEPAPAV